MMSIVMSIARGLPAGPAVVLLTVLVLPQTPIQADRALYEKAELARKQGKEAEALELFEKALERLPDDLDTHVGYQKLLQSQGKDAQLIEEYGKLLEKRQDAWCYYLLGRVLHDPAREEELYRKGLTKDPESFDLRAALAWALKRQVKRAAAAKEYLEALRLRPDSLKTHGRYTDVVRGMGNASTLPDI